MELKHSMHYLYYTFSTLIIATMSQALLCYNCTYSEGHKGSTEDCTKSNPGQKYLIDCITRVVPNSTTTARPQQAFGFPGKAFETSNTISFTSNQIYCVKVDGILSGRVIIYRTCVVKNWDDDRNNQCIQSNASQEILIPDKGNVYGQLCYCTKQKCNVAPAKNKCAFFLIIIFLHSLSQFAS